LKLSQMMPKIRPLLCKVTYETNTKESVTLVQTFANKEAQFGLISTVTDSYTHVVLQKHRHPAQVGVGSLPLMKELCAHVHREVSNAVLPKPAPGSGLWKHVDEAP